MIIDISNIIKLEGAKEAFEGEVVFSEETDFGENIRPANPVRIRGVMENLGGMFDFHAEAEADMIFQCARCLKEFTKTVTVSMDERFSKEGNEEYLKIEHNKADITDAVYMNLLLNLPQRVLCSEQCKGLCSSCGVDRNLSQCDCQKEEGDPRFAVLKNLLK